jgi:hypothetical protein
VPARPDERRGFAHLEALLKEKGSQTLLYVVDFSSFCAPADFFLVEGFFEDFEVVFFRPVFDVRSPPSALPSLFAAALAAAA